MSRIILLRHGRTQANDLHLYCGSTDLPLSESGREELELLRDSCIWPKIDSFRIFTSGMRRAEETLFLIYGDIPHETASDFREMDFGRFEMHSYEELCSDAEYRTWCDGDNESNVAPGGESGNQMSERVIAAFDCVLSRGDDTLIVLHGGPIAAIMAYQFPEQGKNRFEWQPKNGRGYLIEYNDGERTYCPIPAGGEKNGG